MYEVPHLPQARDGIHFEPKFCRADTKAARRLHHRCLLRYHDLPMCLPALVPAGSRGTEQSAWLTIRVCYPMKAEIELMFLPYAEATKTTLVDILIREFESAKRSSFMAAVAFARQSGNYRELLEALVRFANSGATVERNRVRFNNSCV